MNYLDYIENDTRKPNELKEFFKSKYPDHYYLMAESDTKSDWWGETSGVSICVEMYIIAYIHIKKPMTILEYGSGKSTYIMSKVMTDLNYGGRLIAYEDNEDWYKRNKDLGLYENSEVHLVPVLKGERDWCVKDVGGTGTYCYFDHDFSDIDSVDFIFDDGPSFPFGAKYIDNWFMAANHFENPFDLLIDGRFTAQERCKYLYPNRTKIYTKLGVDTDFISHYECGIGTQIGGNK